METQGEDRPGTPLKAKGDYLSVRDMAIYLGVPPEVVHILIKKGSLPVLVRVKERRLFLRTEVEKFFWSQGFKMREGDTR